MKKKGLVGFTYEKKKKNRELFMVTIHFFGL